MHTSTLLLPSHNRQRRSLYYSDSSSKRRSCGVRALKLSCDCAAVDDPQDGGRMRVDEAIEHIKALVVGWVEG